MGTDCPNCQEGLTGTRGHQHLVPDRESADEQALQRYVCAACGSAWHRTYVGDGPFVWCRDWAASPRRFVFAFLASCPNDHSQMHTFRADHLREMIDSREVMLWCGTCGTSWGASDELLGKMKRALAGAASGIDHREA